MFILNFRGGGGGGGGGEEDEKNNPTANRAERSAAGGTFKRHGLVFYIYTHSAWHSTRVEQQKLRGVYTLNRDNLTLGRLIAALKKELRKEGG